MRCFEPRFYQTFAFSELHCQVAIFIMEPLTFVSVFIVNQYFQENFVSNLNRFMRAFRFMSSAHYLYGSMNK